MTRQETFDTVVRAILKQGKPSRDAIGACYYRTHGGLKCAAGHLIPDELYDPKMEGKTVSHMDVRFAVDGHDLGLLSRLQEAHDNAGAHGDEDENGNTLDFVADFRRRVKETAEEYALSDAVLEDA